MITCNKNKICHFLTYPLPFSRSSNFCFFNWCLVFFFNWLCIVFIIITICVDIYVSVCACVCLCGCVCIQACVCVGQRLMSGVFLDHLWPNIYWSGGLSLDSNFSDSASLLSSFALGILSLPCLWLHAGHCTSPEFPWGPEFWNPGVTLVPQGLSLSTESSLLALLIILQVIKILGHTLQLSPQLLNTHTWKSLCVISIAAWKLCLDK